MKTHTPPPFSGSIPKIYEDILGPVYFEPYAVETARQVARLNPLAVLETACGTGRVTNHLLKNLSPECSLVSTDINPDMLAIAKEKYSSSGKVLWMQTDALNVPFESGSFDVVACQFGIMFFPDKYAGMKESCRLLNSTGTFIFSVWDKLESNPFAAAGREILLDFFDQNPPEYFRVPFSFNDPDQIASMLEGAGFPNVKFEKVRKLLIAPSAEWMATGIVEGSLISQAIREKDPGAVDIIKNKIRENIIKKFGDHPARSEMQALIFTANKN